MRRVAILTAITIAVACSRSPAKDYEVEIADAPPSSPKSESTMEGVGLIDWLERLGSIKKIVIFRSSLKGNMTAITPALVNAEFKASRCRNSQRRVWSMTAPYAFGQIRFDDGLTVGFSMHGGCILIDGNLFTQSAVVATDGKSSGAPQALNKSTTTKTEQAGADQPATQPADKSPVKDQPSTPTSKDGPR